MRIDVFIDAITNVHSDILYMYACLADGDEIIRSGFWLKLRYF